MYVLREHDGTVGISTVSLYHRSKILDTMIPTMVDCNSDLP